MNDLSIHDLLILLSCERSTSINNTFTSLARLQTDGYIIQAADGEYVPTDKGDSVLTKIAEVLK